MAESSTSTKARKNRRQSIESDPPCESVTHFYTSHAVFNMYSTEM